MYKKISNFLSSWFDLTKAHPLFHSRPEKLFISRASEWLIASFVRRLNSLHTTSFTHNLYCHDDINSKIWFFHSVSSIYP